MAAATLQERVESLEQQLAHLRESKRRDFPMEVNTDGDASFAGIVSESGVEVVGTQYDSLVMSMADARLIAAAPEMYEALKAMVDCCTNSDGAVSPEPKDRGVWLDNMVAARAVLAKAEGKP